MHFLTSLLQLIAIALCSTEVLAVTLTQYRTGTCRGAARLCTNINARVCCNSRTRVFASGTCTGCTSTDFHLTWNQAGSNFCGRNAAARNGGGCISGGSNLRGHSWCRLCGTRVSEPDVSREMTEDVGDGFECEGMVEPDLVTLDHKTYYKINYGVSKEDTDAILEWVENRGLVNEKIPEYLKKHETTYTP